MPSQFETQRTITRIITVTAVVEWRRQHGRLDVQERPDPQDDGQEEAVLHVAEGAHRTDHLGGMVEIRYLRLRESRAERTAQYSDASTVHGIGYIFERGQAFLPRFAWLLFVMAATAAGVTWSIQVRSRI